MNPWLPTACVAGMWNSEASVRGHACESGLWAQIAKAMGGRVIAVCRGEAKARALTQLGADAVIDTSQHADTPLRALIKVAPVCLSYTVKCMAVAGT